MAKTFLFIFLILFQSLHAKPLSVVVSFSILEDLVHQIGQEKVEVKSLVGRNGDAHVYTPTPADVATVRSADLVFINGLGFEGWIERLIRASGFKGPLVIVSKDIHPRLVFEGRMVEDPHAWHSIPNVLVYVHHIQESLASKDPANAEFYRQKGRAYRNRLLKLDQEIRVSFSNISPPHRKIVTAHDAFSYFGNSYGIQFLSPVGTNTESEPCAQDMRRLIDFIKECGVKVLFLENITNPKLIQQLSNETGARIGESLYSDALSEIDGPAATYEKMMRHNVGLLLKAMREMG